MNSILNLLTIGIVFTSGIEALAGWEPLRRGVVDFSVARGSQTIVWLNEAHVLESFTPINGVKEFPGILLFGVYDNGIILVGRGGGISIIDRRSIVAPIPHVIPPDVVEIGAGDGYFYAIFPSGELATWGPAMGSDEDRKKYGLFPSKYVQPKQKVFVKTASAGASHLLVIDLNGFVHAFGGNQLGECSIPDGLVDIVAVSAGVAHSLALTREGKVIAWGDNRYGQCSVPSDLPKLRAIAAGGVHSMGITEDGRVVTWGGVFCEIRGVVPTSVIPDSMGNVVKIHASGSDCFALNSNGELFVWGNWEHGVGAPPGTGKE